MEYKTSSCENPEPLVWISNPSEFAAGRLNLEVIATDAFGNSTAQDFFVTIPQQPPADPEAPPKPDFKSIKLFREESTKTGGTPMGNAQADVRTRRNGLSTDLHR